MVHDRLIYVTFIVNFDCQFHLGEIGNRNVSKRNEGENIYELHINLTRYRTDRAVLFIGHDIQIPYYVMRRTDSDRKRGQ